MTMATLFYPSAKRDIATGVIDLDTDTFGVMLVTDTYTPSTSHAKRSDITNEVGNSGTYAAGGSALASVTAALSGTELRFDAADPSWTSATITARGCVIYKRRGGASSADELVCALLFTGGADVVSTNGTFTVVFDSTGMAALT